MARAGVISETKVTAEVLQGRPARSAVNLPALSADEMARGAPFLALATQMGSLHTQWARERSGAGRRIEAWRWCAAAILRGCRRRFAFRDAVHVRRRQQQLCPPGERYIVMADEEEFLRNAHAPPIAD